MDMPGVVSRASEGKLAEVGKEGLCRDAVSNNVDVLEPIIKEFGSLAQLKIIKASRALISKVTYMDPPMVYIIYHIDDIGYSIVTANMLII